MNTAAARVELKSFLERHKSEFLAKPGFVALEEETCRKVDAVVLDLWSNGRRIRTGGFALMAVGGYGRGTLHPESDLDLLLFFKDTVDEDVVRDVLNPLWDLPFRIGHQIRQSSDFAAYDPEQIESYAAFLDHRFLMGSEDAATEFANAIFPTFLRRNRDAMLRGLVEAKRQRYARFGSTVFQLEPDLKDAPGGLRDYHWANWVRKTLEAPSEGDPSHALAFHHCIRTFLHFREGRNFNVLSYEFQEQIAPKLSYTDSEHGEAAETMMRDYFLKAGYIARRASMWEEEVAGSPNRIAIHSRFEQPLEMAQAFAKAHREKAGLHAVTLSAIRQRLASDPAVLRNDRSAGMIVVEMMKDRNGIYEALVAMHEVGLLGRIFPDFEEIRCRVIRDFFHRYTVDEHSLIAIRNIQELHPKHRFSRLVDELENPELLILSLLFHDIGKAHRHDPGNHVHPSTEGVKPILEMLGLPAIQVERVVFVIRNHLEMSKIIFRRDLSDQGAVAQFADLVGNVDNLRMLCLLTYADIGAVNAEVLTPWKEDLLWQLYIETYNRLTLGLADDRYDQQPSLERDIDDVLRLLPGDTQPQDIRDFLDGFPRQYLRNTSRKEIAEHFLLSRKLASVPMVMYLARREGNVYDILVMTADRPFLFSKITGVLSYFGMNILRGQAFSNRHGTIFDLISFEDVDNSFEKNPSEVERFELALNSVLEGKVDVDELLRGRMTSVIFQKRWSYGRPAVHFDHDFSARCTIVEIVTSDAVGLLHQIGSIISSHGCNIEAALITTEGHRAIDVFYITREGLKLSPELEKRLEYDLNQALAEP